MKTLFSYILALGMLITLVGCDPFHSSSSSNEDRGARLEFTTRLRTRSMSGFNDGDVMFFDSVDNKRIIITTNTRVSRQSPSCGALERVQPDQISLSDVVTVAYFTSDSMYEGQRHVVRAASIEAYRASCVDPVGSGTDRDLTPCEIFAILENGVCPLTGEINND